MEDFSLNAQHATRNFFKLARFSRLRFVATDFSRWTNWEGKVPAEPKLSANREVGKSAGRKGSE